MKHNGQRRSIYNRVDSGCGGAPRLPLPTDDVPSMQIAHSGAAVGANSRPKQHDLSNGGRAGGANAPVRPQTSAANLHRGHDLYRANSSGPPAVQRGHQAGGVDVGAAALLSVNAGESHLNRFICGKPRAIVGFSDKNASFMMTRTQ